MLNIKGQYTCWHSVIQQIFRERREEADAVFAATELNLQRIFLHVTVGSTSMRIGCDDATTVGWTLSEVLRRHHDACERDESRPLHISGLRCASGDGSELDLGQNLAEALWFATTGRPPAAHGGTGLGGDTGLSGGVDCACGVAPQR